MPAGFGAALAQLCSGFARDAKALWRATRQLDAVRTALALCWELIGQGGIRVQTPPAPATIPLIVTVVQLDGDIMTLVNPKLFECPSDTWAGLGQRHAAAVRAALTPLSCLPDALRAAAAALFAAITLANCGLLASSAVSAGRPSIRALELGGSVAVQAGLLVLWRSTSRLLFRAVALGLRWRFRQVAADRRSESKREVDKLMGSKGPGT